LSPGQHKITLIIEQKAFDFVFFSWVAVSLAK